MGMTAIPFAVDINKVRDVLGCKDRKLLEKLKTANLYDNYASQAENYDFNNTLEDLLFKYVKPEDRKPTSGFFGLKKSKPDSGLKESMGHAYGYGLLVICDYLGTHLLPSCDGFYYGRDFEAAVEIMKEKGLQLDMGMMFEPEEVFDIPKIADFPAIHLYSKPDVEHIVSVITKVDIDDSKADFDNDDFDEVHVMLKNIKDSFTTSKNRALK
jgi:hypothetical protein